MSAASREEASRITERADGRRVGTQAWAIYSKIRDVDRALRSDAKLRRAIREVHPEVCFCAWNEGKPQRWSKKTQHGRFERLALVESWLGDGVLERARSGHPKKDVADDDILDAIAALWTAHRISRGVAVSLPSDVPRDSLGLPMEIVY